MSRPPLKWIMGGAALLVVLGAGAFFVFNHGVPAVPASVPTIKKPVGKDVGAVHSVIGKSVEGRAIETFTYGKGNATVLFVGGMHGGYEWNSVLLAYQAMDYFQAHPESIPARVAVTVIPSANPDGVFKVTGKAGRFTEADVTGDEKSQADGRFNAHAVDLNRNFGCKWKATGMWRGRSVSGGTAAFSEPETRAIRDYILEHRPAAVIFWHSQANAVYASQCEEGILPGTLAVMNAYATASGYPAVKSFDAYPVTGDAEGWLASIGIPAITVELKTHATVEWGKNWAGIQALLEYFR